MRSRGQREHRAEMRAAGYTGARELALDRAARDRHRDRRRCRSGPGSSVSPARTHGACATERSGRPSCGSSRRTTTSSCAASRPISRRCRRPRSARRPLSSGDRLQPGPPRGSATGSRPASSARGCWAGSAGRSPCCGTPGSRTTCSRSRCAPRRSAVRRDPDRARLEPGGARDSVDRHLERRRVDARAGVADPDEQRDASTHPVALERDRRRPRVVDPEAEREAPGACVRGAVEDDVVGARDAAARHRLRARAHRTGPGRG